MRTCYFLTIHNVCSLQSTITWSKDNRCNIKSLPNLLKTNPCSTTKRPRIAYYQLHKPHTDIFKDVNRPMAVWQKICRRLLLIQYMSHLSGVMVRVLATGLKVLGFKPGRGDGFLRAIKIGSTPSFRGKVKPSTPCHKILRHAKEPCIVWQGHFSPIPCFTTRCLCCNQRALMDEWE
jgi:hypothetical protein